MRNDEFDLPSYVARPDDNGRYGVYEKTHGEWFSRGLTRAEAESKAEYENAHITAKIISMSRRPSTVRRRRR